MKFKKFEKHKVGGGRSFNAEVPKIELKHREFFDEVKRLKIASNYDEWKADAMFLLFLKPDIDKEHLHPENIDKYYEEVVFKR